MHNIYDCVDAFSHLLYTQYEITLGRKGVAVTLKILFDKRDCFHLMGLQYLTDREELTRDRTIVFDEIKNRKINNKHLENSKFYEKIRERVNMLPLLETLFDSNETIFKYNSKRNSFSLIQADYLMKNQVEDKSAFIFLSNEKEDIYFCRSFFTEGKMDYSKNQPSWTLLYKKKIDLVSQTEIVLYDRMKYKRILS